MTIFTEDLKDWWDRNDLTLGTALSFLLLGSFVLGLLILEVWGLIIGDPGAVQALEVVAALIGVWTFMASTLRVSIYLADRYDRRRR